MLGAADLFDGVFDGYNQTYLFADGAFVVAAAVFVVAAAAAVGVDVERSLRSGTHGADFAAAGAGKLVGAAAGIFGGLFDQAVFDGFEIAEQVLRGFEIDGVVAGTQGEDVLVGGSDAVEFAAGHGELLFAVVAVGGADFVAVGVVCYRKGRADFGRGGLDFGGVKTLAEQKLFEFRTLLAKVVEHFLIAGAVHADGGVLAGVVGLEILLGQTFYGDGAGLAEVFELGAEHEGSGNETDGEQGTEGLNVAGEGFS